MTKRDDRINEGRNARIKAEIEKSLNGTPIKYSCVYLRIEQASQYKRGWHSPSEIDIATAINQYITQPRDS